MKKLTILLCFVFSLFTVQQANATLIIICNGDDVDVYYDNDGVNEVVAYGCDFS